MRPEPTKSASDHSVRPSGGSRGLKHAFRALRHRDFALMWTGAFISHTGTWMQNTTVPFVIFQLTDSTRWLGFAAFCQFFPALPMGPFGGTLADRMSRRRLLLLTQAGAALVALVLWAVWSTDNATPWLIVGLVAASGVIFGLGQPSWH